MKIFLSALILALVGAVSASAAPISPEAIARDIDLHGARAVVHRLFADGDYERVMDRIDTGDARFIALALRLAPGTDAGTAEELPIALAFALPKNPRAVLGVLGPNGFPVTDVCSAPFIEDTVKDIPGYIRSAQRAVSSVDDPKLAKVRDACLAQLAQALHGQ